MPRVAAHLLATGTDDEQLARVIAVIRATGKRADGSYHIDLTDRLQIEALGLEIHAMLREASTGLRRGPDDLANMTSARALLKQIKWWGR